MLVSHNVQTQMKKNPSLFAYCRKANEEAMRKMAENYTLERKLVAMAESYPNPLNGGALWFVVSASLFIFLFQTLKH